MRITRLGEGVDATRRLRPEAMERTFAALREFRSIMDAHDVVRARLVATSAVRDAENGDAFLRPASEIIGVPAELLSGEEEGRLSYAGATAGLPAGEAGSWSSTSAAGRPRSSPGPAARCGPCRWTSGASG